MGKRGAGSTSTDYDNDPYCTCCTPLWGRTCVVRKSSRDDKKKQLSFSVVTQIQQVIRSNTVDDEKIVHYK